jgi:hypothetical protein
VGLKKNIIFVTMKNKKELWAVIGWFIIITVVAFLVS